MSLCTGSWDSTVSIPVFSIIFGYRVLRILTLCFFCNSSKYGHGRRTYFWSLKERGRAARKRLIGWSNAFSIFIKIKTKSRLTKTSFTKNKKKAISGSSECLHHTYLALIRDMGTGGAGGKGRNRDIIYFGIVFSFSFSILSSFFILSSNRRPRDNFSFNSTIIYQLWWI